MDVIIIKGEKGKTFKIDLKDPIQKRYELIRELNLSSKKREEICTKYGYSRKTGNEYLNAWEEEKWDGLKDNPRGPKTKSKRTEEIEKRIVDIRFKDPEKDMYDIAKILESESYKISARSVGRVLSEHGITLKKNEAEALTKEPNKKIEKPELEDLLTTGFQTNYGGAFLLLPYIFILEIDKLIHSLGVKKQKGISTLQSVLTLIFLAVIGKKRVSKGETIKDYGIAAIAGFSKMPSKSYLHNFLDQITVSCAENFQIASAKAFNKLGIFKSKIINLDGHFIGYFGKSKIGKDKHPTRNISMRGIKAFFCQDQETGNPILARVAYPRKGLTPENVTIPMLEIVKDILPEMEKVVFDKWFSVGSLLEYLDKKMKLKYITLIKLYENRIEEMKSIPLDEFRPLIGTDRLIGFKETNLRNFSGNMKLIVVRFFEDDIEKYYGYLTNDYESSEEQILNEKSWRWRIENFFKNCNFLGIDALPSIELNKIAAMLAMKLFAFNLIACLRKDLGGDFEKKTVESIFEELIEFPAFVKTNGERIIVTFHGNYKDNQKDAIEKLMEKWDETGMNVPISWLGNRRIEVRFK